MRIIGGQFRSRLIYMPKDTRIRPTQDRIRESIFNILGPLPEAAEVLDLFAGSGSFGLEAISRGAKSALFVDNNINSLKAVEKNILSLGVKARTSILKADAFNIITKLYYRKAKFDLIFLDPPYFKDKRGIRNSKDTFSKDDRISPAKKALIMMDEYDILKPSGLIIAEHFKKNEIGALKNLFIKRSVFYGETGVSFIHSRP